MTALNSLSVELKSVGFHVGTGGQKTTEIEDMFVF